MRKREVEKEKKEPERGKLVRVEWDDLNHHSWTIQGIGS